MFCALQGPMTEFHVIRNIQLRETVQLFVAALGIVGVVIAVLSFIF